MNTKDCQQSKQHEPTSAEQQAANQASQLEGTAKQITNILRPHKLISKPDRQEIKFRTLRLIGLRERDRLGSGIELDNANVRLAEQRIP